MAGYTRQSTFADGDTITAALFNNEYNQLLNAFSNTGGHKHDGTANEGPVIGLIGDAGETAPNNKVLIDTTNNYIEFYVQVSDSPVQQMYIADGAIIPVTDNDIDLGTSSLQFKDLYINGTANIDSLVLATGSTVTAVLDEDDLSSDSATSLVTQQSVKAYIDAQVTAQDLDFLGDSGGALSIDLDSESLTIAGGTGLDTVGSGNTVTVNIDATVATLTGSQTLTNKTIDVDNNTVSNIEVDNFKASAIVLESEGIGSNDNDTSLPTSAAVKDYVDTQITAEDLDITTDSGTIAIDLDSETLTVSGGTGLDSSATGNAVTLAIDSTVTTLTGTQTLTNKTLTSPDVNTPDIDGGTIDGATIATSDVTVGAGKTLDVSAGTLTLADNQISGDKVEGGTIAATTITDLTFGSLNDGTITATAFVDEDNMASNSATLIPTQQSVKAYVDTTVAATNEVVEDTTPQLGGDLDTNGNDIVFGDNDKAVFGTGSDLQIYHDGSNSYIKENGTGALNIAGQGNINFTNSAGDETYAQFTSNSSVKLYHDNSIKLTTSSTGIDVTGTATMDGLTVDGDGEISSSLPRLILNETDTTDLNTAIRNNAGVFRVQTVNDAADTFTKRIDLDHATGDISFYEDTGTTAQMTWDASADALTFTDNTKAIFGAGSDLEIYSDGGSNNYILSNNGALILRNLSDDKDIYLQSDDGAGGFTSYLHAKGSSGEVILKHYGSNKLATTSTGIDVTGIIVSDGMSTNTSGTSNFIAGVNAGNSIVSGGNYNTVVGDEAGTAITTGDENTFIGYQSGDGTTTAIKNTAVGAYSLGDNTTGDNNTAIGRQALKFNTTADNNTAVGFHALQVNTTGASNVAVGTSALAANTTASSNTAVGKEAMLSTTTGDSNTGIGKDSLRANTTADDNTAVGHSSLKANTTGALNTAVGKSALAANTTGADNVAVGATSLDANTTGYSNSALGRDSLTANTEGHSNVAVGQNTMAANTTGDGNTAVGQAALDANTTANNNTAVGKSSLGANTTGTNNAAVGMNSLLSNTTGDQNTALGKSALASNTTASNNTALGYIALNANTTGASNTAVGANSLDACTTGNNNTAIGLNSLGANTTGGQNVSVGDNALAANTTATYNTAVGTSALLRNTTGDQNVAIGAFTLDTNTTGNYNTALGYQSLRVNTTASNNTGIGYKTLLANTTGTENTAVGALALDACTTGDRNTAVGYIALSSITGANDNTAIGREALRDNTANDNTAVGKEALKLNTSGGNNTAVGKHALNVNTTGTENTAVGSGSLDANTTGNNSVAFGRDSLTDNTTGSNNTGLGDNALANNTTASNNTAVGKNALLANTTGFNNTSIGQSAGGALTTGDNNICIGFEAGTHSTSLQTGDNNILIGNYIDATASDTSNAIGIGYNIDAEQGYATIGINTSDIRAQHGVATWATVSDERYKKDIADSTAGLSFINALQPRTFKYKNLGELPESFSAYKADSTEVFKNANTNHGFIAQEVKAAIDADSSIKDGFRLWDDREDGSQEVAEAALIPILVKAIQEQNALIEALTTRITTLEG